MNSLVGYSRDPAPKTFYILKNQRFVKWRYSVLKSYYENQNSFNCKIGDVVKIFKKPNKQELNNWNIPWAEPEMTACVGKTGTILRVDDNGILVLVPEIRCPSAFQEYGWYFPYTSLEIIR